MRDGGVGVKNGKLRGWTGENKQPGESGGNSRKYCLPENIEQAKRALVDGDGENIEKWRKNGEKASAIKRNGVNSGVYQWAKKKKT